MPAATGLGDIPGTILACLSGLQPLSPLPVTSLALSAHPWELLMGQVLLHPVPIVSAAHPAGSVHGHQCHQAMASLWTPPNASSHPPPLAPSRQRIAGCIPMSGTLQKPEQKLWFFYSDLWPSGAHHLAFHLHPKSHFNYTSGRDHFRELLFGAKFWWEKNLMNSRTILKGPRRLESQPEACPCQ